MTLLTRLEDSEEGLIGFTEDNKRVHVGIPRSYSCVHSIKPGENCHYSEDIVKFEESLRKSEDAYWYFDRECIACVAYTGNPNSVKYTYTRFEMDKQKSFELEEESYMETILFRDRFVKIHRKAERE